MNDEYIKIVKKFDVFSEGIKCLLCGEYSIAKLLFNKIERSNQEIEFFRKIDVFLDDNRSNFDLESSEITKIRWMFECFAFGLIKKHNDFSIDCALITFSQSNDYVTAIFKPFLLDLYPIPKMSDHLANEFAKALFNFYAKYTSMFRILKPFFHSMIIEVNDNRLFKLLNHSAYYLYQNIPVKYLSIDNFQNKEIKNIIYYTQNTKELLIFQTDFSNKFFYPNEFPVSFNSSACSMALSSIHLGVHFVDLFSQLIKEKIEKVDLDTIPNIAKVIPEFVPFLFAAYQPLIYRFPNKYLRLISAELPILNEFSFKIKELQHRFISDIIIQKLYEKLNIIDISIDCFSKNSIPYHFYGFYDQIVCNSFENRSFYIYSDHEKNCDYDFLHSNYAINEFIILIGSNSHESRRSMIQKHFDNIEKHMKMIKNDFTRQITSTDLFSLIFLRDSNNSFLCHPAFALILIKLLRNLSPNDQFLLKSEFIMSQNYTDNKYIDITSYFTGNLTNLLELLGQKKWDIADHMTKYSSKKFRHIFLLSRSIELHGSSQACLFDCNEVQSMLNIELLLTNNNLCQNHMKSICNCSIKNSNDFINPNSPFLATMNDNLKIILENRLKIEAKYIFSPYTSFMWKDAELIARSFDTNPLNFIYSRKIQQFTEKPPTNSSFMDFLKYISRYFWSYNHDTTNKIIKLDAIGVISHLFNQNKIKKAEKMATLFNMNLFYVAMNHQKQFNFSSESVNYFKTKYPLECLEICYHQFPGDTDLKGLNPFIIKFLKNSAQNISYENIPKNIIPISRSKSNDVLMKENIKRSISKSDQKNYHFAPLFFSNKKQKIKSVPSKISTNPKRNNTLREYFHMHLPNYKNRKIIYQQNTEKSNFQKTNKNEQKRNDILFLKFILRVRFKRSLDISNKV